MNIRSRERLDYKTYHESGRKVTKVGGGTQNPEMDEQKIHELKLREDITHAFDIYAIDNLVTEVEIQEALSVISDICKCFRHLHVDLKNALDAEYDIQFPDYNEKLGRLTNFIKTAKNKLRYMKQEVEERLYREEK